MALPLYHGDFYIYLNVLNIVFVVWIFWLYAKNTTSIVDVVVSAHSIHRNWWVYAMNVCVPTITHTGEKNTHIAAYMLFSFFVCVCVWESEFEREHLRNLHACITHSCSKIVDARYKQTKQPATNRSNIIYIVQYYTYIKI